MRFNEHEGVGVPARLTQAVADGLVLRDLDHSDLMPWRPLDPAPGVPGSTVRR